MSSNGTIWNVIDIRNAAMREKGVRVDEEVRSGQWLQGFCLHTIATSFYINSNLIQSLFEILSCFHLCEHAHLKFTWISEQQIISMEILTAMEATVLWLGNANQQVHAGARSVPGNSLSYKIQKYLWKNPRLLHSWQMKTLSQILTFLGCINGECAEKRLFSVMFIS